VNARQPTIVVLGSMTTMPVAGIVWLTVPYLVGLRRLGYDVYYVEAHARTPSMLMRAPDDDGAALAAGFIDRVMRRFGFADRWAYHALHADGRVYGISEPALRHVYRSADFVFNLHGGTEPLPEHAATGRLVLIETDPVELEIELHRGEERAWRFLDAHCAVFTWGTNFGNPDCRVPLPPAVDFRPSRMPILLDQWQLPELQARDVFTTVGNWQQAWRDVEYAGEVFTWSKHQEFMKVLDLPRRTDRRFELALASCDEPTRQQLVERGWNVRHAAEISSDLDAYRRYIVSSRAEFTVAKDQNVRLRSGWFSDRSAAYLAAGRPVVTQETGFSSSLPVGDGLFAFTTLEEAVDAISTVDRDYPRHSRAALELAQEFFDYRVVLGETLGVLGARPRRAAPAKAPRRGGRSLQRAACTIISKNYLAHARVLAESFVSSNPDVPFFVLLVDRNDGSISSDREAFEVIELGELGAPDLVRLCFQYSVIELNTAAKPYFLSRLMNDRGIDRLIYFDPDILVVNHLGELWDLLESHSIVLTPHLTEPIEDDGKKPSEIDILLSGTYNLGFLGIAKSGTTARLLSWWQDRLHDRCVVAPDEGLFTDQRWMDLVPGFFDDVHILRQPGYNVAYWNLHCRRVSVRDDDIRVNGEPAFFFHFSGLDPREPVGISKHQTRFRLDELGDLEQVFDRYRELLFAAGYEALKGLPYAFAKFDNGVAIPDVARSLYRRLGSDADRFGDPFQTHNVGSFFRWLVGPVPDDAVSERPISRLWYEVYGLRPDVRHAFPDVFGADREDFLRWTHLSGIDELGIDPALLPEARGGAAAVDRPADREAGRPFGVNVAGHFGSEKGMGEAVRSDVRLLRAAGIPFVVDDFVDSWSENPEITSGQAGGNPYAFNLVHLNADRLPAFAEARGRDYFEGRYTIGYWTWELSEFPADWRSSFENVDEVWVPSTFALDAIARVATKPVLRIEHVLEPSAPVSLGDRSNFGLPEDAFLFLFMFDFHSFVERKNPFGLIEAFRRAFTASDNVGLVLKYCHSEYAPELHEALTCAAEGAQVYFVDAVLNRPQVNLLMSLVDAYASLHRSEGFGLTMAEAMALGKPVVATGYSGNTDFMRPSNSFLVDYELVQIDRDHGPYRRGSVWANPDLEQAAKLLRLVVDDPEAARAKAALGRHDVLRELDPRVAGRVVLRRLSEIYDRSGSMPLTQAHAAAPSDLSMYDALVQRVREKVADVVPPKSELAVVSKGDEQLLLLGNRRCSHFPRTPAGAYAGHYPANDDEAIAQVEEARANGVEYLVFPSTANWWLEYYSRLRAHLESHYVRLLEDPGSCVVYQLALREEPPDAMPTAENVADESSLDAYEDDSIDGAYMSLVHAVREHIQKTIPSDAAVAILSKGDDALVSLNGRRAWHFPTSGNGEYAGYYPSDSRAAIAELETTRQRGVRYLVIPKPSFWWLGFYVEFAEHLRNRYSLVLTSAECLIYDLVAAEGANGRGKLSRLLPRRGRRS
jgi:glycosyltransferase involved in cell wall biosynthesis